MVLSSDGYFLTYERERNRIVISLPQTMETVQSTYEQISDRKLYASVSELTMVLNLVKLIFQKDD